MNITDMGRLGQDVFFKPQKPWYQLTHQTGYNWEFNEEKLSEKSCHHKYVLFQLLSIAPLLCEIYFPVECFSTFATHITCFPPWNLCVFFFYKLWQKNWRLYQLDNKNTSLFLSITQGKSQLCCFLISSGYIWS